EGTICDRHQPVEGPPGPAAASDRSCLPRAKPTNPAGI
ncbi:MAG: hypothetical protein AVDCRST_MAG56-3327, partial [uncultured Cytophagales bacterium]